MTVFEINRRMALLQKILRNQGRTNDPQERVCHLKLAEQKSLKRQLAKLSATRKVQTRRKGRRGRETPLSMAVLNLPADNQAEARRAHTEMHKFWTDCPFC